MYCYTAQGEYKKEVLKNVEKFNSNNLDNIPIYVDGNLIDNNLNYENEKKKLEQKLENSKNTCKYMLCGMVNGIDMFSDKLKNKLNNIKEDINFLSNGVDEVKQNLTELKKKSNC